LPALPFPSSMCLCLPQCMFLMLVVILCLPHPYPFPHPCRKPLQGLRPLQGVPAVVRQLHPSSCDQSVREALPGVHEAGEGDKEKSGWLPAHHHEGLREERSGVCPPQPCPLPPLPLLLLLSASLPSPLCHSSSSTLPRLLFLLLFSSSSSLPLLLHLCSSSSSSSLALFLFLSSPLPCLPCGRSWT
jgi:hypothetical protein